MEVGQRRIDQSRRVRRSRQNDRGKQGGSKIPEAKKKGELEGSKCYCEFKIKQVINYPHKSGQWRGLERESTLESSQEGMVKEEAETSVASYFEETFLRKGRKIKQ